jgi:hypothetical protein
MKYFSPEAILDRYPTVLTVTIYVLKAEVPKLVPFVIPFMHPSTYYKLGLAGGG